MIQPTVSLVIPIKDEGAYLPALLDQIERQTYPADRFEVIFANGGSRDRSQEVVEGWAAGGRSGPHIRLLSNPEGTTADGLNVGIDASISDIIIILGGHADIPDDWVERSVESLIASGASCAGGRIETRGRGPVGSAIALAMSSPFGVGNATFRTGAAEAGFVDTVAFGAYRRETLEELGGFDPCLVGAEDDELNFRLLRHGGRIWFDPAITSTYYCRSTYRDVCRQYLGYGRGKARVLRKHDAIPSLRALVPPTFLAVLLSAVLARLLGRRGPLRWVLGAYLAGATAAALEAADCEPVEVARVGAAFAAIHFSYGTGVLLGLLSRRADVP